MYLRFLVEGGVFGLAFYLALMTLLWRATSGLQRMLVLQIIIASFFSHNLLESPVIIIAVTFMLARQALQRHEIVEAQGARLVQAGVTG